MLRAMNVAGLSEVEKRVVKATYDDEEVPKAKHVEALILLSADHELLPYIDKRLIQPLWNVVCKALILVHRLSLEGDERFLSELLASPALLSLPQSFDAREDPTASSHSAFIASYAAYLQCKVETFGRVKRSCERYAPVDSQRWAMRLTALQLSRHLPRLQRQFDRLLLTVPRHLEDTGQPIVIAAMSLCIKDAFRLYSTLTVMMLGVLEVYEQMALKATRLMLHCTQRFLVQNRKFKLWASKLCKLGLVERKLLPSFDAVAHTAAATLLHCLPTVATAPSLTLCRCAVWSADSPTFLQLLEEHIQQLGVRSPPLALLAPPAAAVADPRPRLSHCVQGVVESPTPAEEVRPAKVGRGRGGGLRGRGGERAAARRSATKGRSRRDEYGEELDDEDEDGDEEHKGEAQADEEEEEEVVVTQVRRSVRVRGSVGRAAAGRGAAVRGRSGRPTAAARPAAVPGRRVNGQRAAVQEGEGEDEEGRADEGYWEEERRVEEVEEVEDIRPTRAPLPLRAKRATAGRSAPPPRQPPAAAAEEEEGEEEAEAEESRAPPTAAPYGRGGRRPVASTRPPSRPVEVSVGGLLDFAAAPSQPKSAPRGAGGAVISSRRPLAAAPTAIVSAAPPPTQQRRPPPPRSMTAPAVQQYEEEEEEEEAEGGEGDALYEYGEEEVDLDDPLALFVSSSLPSSRAAPLTSNSRAAAKAKVQAALSSELNLFDNFDPLTLHPAEAQALERQHATSISALFQRQTQPQSALSPGGGLPPPPYHSQVAAYATADGDAEGADPLEEPSRPPTLLSPAPPTQPQLRSAAGPSQRRPPPSARPAPPPPPPVEAEAEGEEEEGQGPAVLEDPFSDLTASMAAAELAPAASALPVLSRPTSRPSPALRGRGGGRGGGGSRGGGRGGSGSGLIAAASAPPAAAVNSASRTAMAAAPQRRAATRPPPAAQRYTDPPQDEYEDAEAEEPNFL